MLRPIPIKLCHTKEMCRPRSPGLPLRLGRSPTLESRVREWPGCFPVDLTKTRVFWEGKPQLWTYLHQIVFRQVCSAFSWIMTYVGGPSLGRCCRPGQVVLSCIRKLNMPQEIAFLHASVSAAKPQVFLSSFPDFPQGWVVAWKLEADINSFSPSSFGSQQRKP